MLSVKAAVARAIPVSGEKLLLLSTLSFGHMLMHCLQYGWLVLLPPIKLTFGLNDVQYGGIESARSLSSFLVNIPAGAVADLLKRRWAALSETPSVRSGWVY